MDWMKRMCLRASDMPDIQACIREVEKWEKPYCDIRDSLPEKQRMALESYLSACEELDHAMMWLAHEEGREQGLRER